jgi:hypothetical protein
MGARSAERSQAAAQRQPNQDAQIAQLQAQQAAGAAPVQAAPAELDAVAQIQKFATLKDQGLITEEEFAAKKEADPRHLAGARGLRRINSLRTSA